MIRDQWRGSCEEWDRFHMRHAELHWSYCVPVEDEAVARSANELMITARPKLDE